MATMTGTVRGSSGLMWVAVVLLAALLITGFWISQIALGGHGYPGFGDALHYYYPHYKATFGLWGQGELPLWNPYQLCGVPWLPALQIGAFYPPHLLYVFLPTHLAMAALSLMHFLLAGIAMIFFARRAGLSVLAALLAAILFTMRGEFSFKSSVPNLLETGAWLVPGAVAVLGISQPGGWRWISLLAISTGASLLAGYPQYTVYSVYTWAALMGVLLLGRRAPRSGWVRAAAAFAGAIALGSLLASVVLVPTVEQSFEATRNLEGLTLREMYPFGIRGSIAGALQLLLKPRPGDLPMSLGFVGLLLLPFAFAVPRHRPLAFGTIGIGLLAMGVALGPVTPLFDLYLALPTTSSFRNPMRILLIRDFCFAVAAALGLEGTRWLMARTKWRKLQPGNAIAVLVVVAAALELFAASPRRPRLPYFEDRQTSVYTTPHRLYSKIADDHRRVLFWNPGFASRLPPKLGSIFRMRSIDDIDPMSLRRQADYFTFLSLGTIQPKTSWPQPFHGQLRLPSSPTKASAFATRQRLLDLAAVRYVLAPAGLHDDPAVQSYVEAVGLRRTAPPSRGLVLFTNPRVLPRAFVTHRVKEAPPADELLAILSRSDFDPMVESYAEGAAASLPAGGEPPAGRPARIVVDEPTVVEIEADLDAPGLVVLADSYYPGWTATVDGEPTRILPTNHLFRGVVATAGRHRIRYTYRPGSLAGGGVLSGVGLLLVLLIVWHGCRRPS